MKYDVFISYSSKDKDFATELAHDLEQEGLTVFIDYKEIKTGGNYHKVIEDSIENSSTVAVLWSSSSVESEWVINEANLGREKNVLFPILIEDVKIPLAFRSLQLSDLKSWEGDHNDTVFIQLVSDIRTKLKANVNTDSQQQSTPAPAPRPRIVRKTNNNASTWRTIFGALGWLLALVLAAIIIFKTPTIEVDNDDWVALDKKMLN